MSTKNDLKTPEEWCLTEGVEILDPDGWRGHNGRPWTDPISLAEFHERLITCTQRRVQAAGEHHTGTLNLAGAGNPPQDSPISDDLADLVLAVKERGVPCPPNCDYQTHRRAEVRAELEAVYTAIRQHIAEQIAAKAHAIAEDCNTAAKAHRELSIDNGGTTTRKGASHMQTALAFSHQAAGAWAAAEAAREIGGTA